MVLRVQPNTAHVRMKVHVLAHCLCSLVPMVAMDQYQVGDPSAKILSPAFLNIRR